MQERISETINLILKVDILNYIHMKGKVVPVL
jgi:hypothetical protein